MADGEEEREELKKRREQQKREDRDDQLEHGYDDPWQPERVDS